MGCVHTGTPNIYILKSLGHTVAPDGEMADSPEVDTRYVTRETDPFQELHLP